MRASVAVSASPLSAESAAGGSRDVDFLAGAVCVVCCLPLPAKGGGGGKEGPEAFLSSLSSSATCAYIGV